MRTKSEKIIEVDNKLSVISLLSLLLFGLCFNSVVAFAETAEKDTSSSISVIDTAEIETVPFRFAEVHGDIEKFKADNWARDDYSGGISHFSLRGGGEDGWRYHAGGHAIVNANDFEGFFRIENKDVGYLEFEYEEFRKYYDNNGGVYHHFTGESVSKLDRSLSLDIGHFGVELGITPPDLPHLFFLYEREYKDGAKSRLTWGEREEGGITRNIAPSWQEIEERVDVFEIREEYKIKNVKLEGKQRWEVAKNTLRRWEVDTSPSGTLGDNHVRIQDQNPESTIFTNTVKAGAWFGGDKIYTSGGYHYMHLNNNETEEIGSFDQDLNRVFIGFDHNQKNYGENDVDLHALNFSVFSAPLKSLTVTAGVKGEFKQRDGASILLDERTNPPDNSPEREYQSDTENQTRKMGQSLKIRFKGIPRTALYAEGALEQGRDYVSEDRERYNLPGRVFVPGDADTLERETTDDQAKGTFTIGMSNHPVRMVQMTNQFRYKRSNHDYDHARETTPGSTAFYDEIDSETAEFSSRITIRPVSWFNTSLRYTVQDVDYWTRYDSQNRVQSSLTSDSITFDVTVMPLPNLTVTSSFNRYTSSLVNSVVRDSLAGGAIPTFNSDVNTWMLHVDATPLENVTARSSIYYANATNFNDVVESVGYGAAYDRVGLETEIEVQVSEHIAFVGSYEYQNYTPDSRYSQADYSAHIVGGKISASFG